MYIANPDNMNQNIIYIVYSKAKKIEFKTS